MHWNTYGELYEKTLIKEAQIKNAGYNLIKIWENDFNLSYIMQGIKWFLVLTADEFCNASPTRMSINRMLWQKQLENTGSMGTDDTSKIE